MLNQQNIWNQVKYKLRTILLILLKAFENIFKYYMRSYNFEYLLFNTYKVVYKK